MEKITITRALAELKLLDARIKKQIQGARFVDVYQQRNKRALKSNESIDNFEKNVKSVYESISDLIKRRNDMKCAIVKSNAETIVKIAGKEYSVAEAIDRKSSIEYEQLLLNKLRSDYVSVSTEIENSRIQLENQVQNMLVQNLGADKKVEKDAYDNIAKPFIEANELNMIDPVGIKKKIDEIEKSVDEFLSEIDFVLSESNAKTKIEV